MKDQVRVQRIGSEIQVQVRDQTLIVWNDEAAKHVAEEILKLVEPEKSDVIPDGTRVTIVETKPEDWDSSWWPYGRAGVVRGSFKADEGRTGYRVDLDDESDGDLYFGPDYYLAEDLDIVRPS